jgi:hypothetical protein
VTFPHSPKPGPTPGGYRPSPPPGGFRPGPPPSGPQPSGPPPSGPQPSGSPGYGEPVRPVVPSVDGATVDQTGHPAVDAVLRSLENAARLAPAEQIAEYEAAHQVLQETLATIDG